MTAVPILLYHQVTPRPHPRFRKYSVTPGAFVRQVRWLARAGYRTVPLETLRAAREGRAALPDRPVVLTFDDGFHESAEQAVPILEEHGFVATFFLVAGLAGGTSRWLAGERGIELPLFGWAEARRLEERGFRCGVHTLTHPRLAELPAAACRRELAESRRLMEDQLGRPVRELAYPFGSFSPEVREIAAEAGYQTACSSRPGLSPAEDDPLALCRIPIEGGDSLLDFACRLRTGRTVRQDIERRAKGVWRRLRREGWDAGRAQ